MVAVSKRLFFSHVKLRKLRDGYNVCIAVDFNVELFFFVEVYILA